MANLLVVLLFIGVSWSTVAFTAILTTQEKNYDNLSELVDKAILVLHSHHPHVFVSEFSGVEISFNLYNSKFDSSAIYKHNCVATPSDAVVDCDLDLAAELVSEFKLIESSGRVLFGGITLRQYYERYIVEWIIAHEIGHVLAHHRDGSDFADSITGFMVFDAAAQQRELAADEAAVKMIGNSVSGPVQEYVVVLDIANSLVRKSVCPKTFPQSCPEMPYGVGLIYDYYTQKPIRISLSGSHPAYVARFLRLLYLAGIGTSDHSINYEAGKAIQLLQVEISPGSWSSIKSTLLGKE